MGRWPSSRRGWGGEGDITIQTPGGWLTTCEAACEILELLGVSKLVWIESGLRRAARLTSSSSSGISASGGLSCVGRAGVGPCSRPLSGSVGVGLVEELGELGWSVGDV